LKFVDTLVLRTPYGLTSRVRISAYRLLGCRIGPRCRLENMRLRRPSQISIGAGNSFAAGCWLYPEDSAFRGIRIRIGDCNFFNRDVMIDACGLIEIGDNNMFGPGVYVGDSNHTMETGRWVAECPLKTRTVRIGNGCWIGARALILSGVELGDRCIVAAGAVVTKSVPAGITVAGVPARVIGTAACV
jgi:acetyltransferase-like isoleucine patch superfamily enzyme